MEEALRQASREGAKVLVIRAGDFFGPAAPNSALGWLTNRRAAGGCRSVIGPGPRRRRPCLRLSARPRRNHVCLIDRARTNSRISRSSTSAGHWLARGDDLLLRSIRRVTGNPRLPILPFPLPADLGPRPRSTRPSASFWKCATCGAAPSASTMPSWSVPGRRAPHPAGLRREVRDPGRHGLPGPQGGADPRTGMGLAASSPSGRSTGEAGDEGPLQAKKARAAGREHSCGGGSLIRRFAPPSPQREKRMIHLTCCHPLSTPYMPALSA